MIVIDEFLELWFRVCHKFILRYCKEMKYYGLLKDFMVDDIDKKKEYAVDLFHATRSRLILFQSDRYLRFIGLNYSCYHALTNTRCFALYSMLIFFKSMLSMNIDPNLEREMVRTLFGKHPIERLRCKLSMIILKIKS